MVYAAHPAREKKHALAWAQCLDCEHAFPLDATAANDHSSHIITAQSRPRG
jgi:hypothetical protein